MDIAVKYAKNGTAAEATAYPTNFGDACRIDTCHMIGLANLLPT